VSFQDHSSEAATKTGDELMNAGVKVTLGEPEDSEIVYVSKMN
jgi:hypothetical protein